MPNVKPIPEGYHAITPYLVVNGAAAAIRFYEQAFGAKELFRMPGAGGKVGHAEMLFGDSPVMLADEHPEMGAVGPRTVGGNPTSLLLYVANCDEVVARAQELGAVIRRPLQDQFYGDRSATLEDPFGHVWTVATHIEDVSPEEMNRRAQAMHA